MIRAPAHFTLCAYIGKLHAVPINWSAGGENIYSTKQKIGVKLQSEQLGSMQSSAFWVEL